MSTWHSAPGETGFFLGVEGSGKGFCGVWGVRRRSRRKAPGEMSRCRRRRRLGRSCVGAGGSIVGAVVACRFGGVHRRRRVELLLWVAMWSAVGCGGSSKSQVLLCHFHYFFLIFIHFVLLSTFLWTGLLVVVVVVSRV